MMTLKEIISTLISSDQGRVNSLVRGEKLTVRYKEADSSGNLNTKSKTLELSGLKLGLQDKAENLNTEDPSSGANVTLGEAETIAYAIYKNSEDLMTEIQNLRAEVEALKRLLEAL